MPASLLSHRAGPILTLTLNRPEKRNALSGELVQSLLDALAAAEEDDGIRVIVLTGAGQAFSAGADLEVLEKLQHASPAENIADSERLSDLFAAIYRHPKAVIARVNGHAIAGGCGLAAVCDLSIAAEEAKLGFTEVRIGFVPAIVSVFVLRKIGEAAARGLFLRGQLIDAREAADVGLITEVVPAAGLDERVDELAAELARETSGTAIALTKKLLASVQGLALDDALEQAVQMNALARSTDDCRAGVEAFLSRTAPPWRRPEVDVRPE
jgi:methylglutaconyl-CoA hydratase